MSTCKAVGKVGGFGTWGKILPEASWSKNPNLFRTAKPLYSNLEVFEGHSTFNKVVCQVL